MAGQEKPIFYDSAVFKEGTGGTTPSEFQKIFDRLHTAKAIVLFDLDKTAIGPNYQPTNLEGLKTIIDTLQKNGVLVGIHSDSPLETVMQFAEMFGVEGPLVYEMAGIHFPEKTASGNDVGIDIALDIEPLDFFQALRERFFETAGRVFPDTDSAKFLISQETDFNKATREENTFTGITHGIWINPLRMFSLGFWAKDIDQDGTPKLDYVLHQQVDALLRRVLSETSDAPDVGDLDWDYNPEYGATIIKLKSLSSKTPPVQTILDVLAGGFDKPVFMIGDSPADYITDSRVTTLAVGNARDDLRQIILSQQLSEKTYTDGVIDHMIKIAIQLGIES